MTRTLLLLFLCMSTLACGDDDTACTSDGECAGQFCVDGRCTPPPDTSPRDLGGLEDTGTEDTGDGGITMDMGGSDVLTDVLADALADAGSPLPPNVPEPPRPTFPTRASILTVTLQTADVRFAGTSDDLEVCLSADQCIRLAADRIAIERGDVDTAHVAISLSRADIDRVVLRTTSPASEDNNQHTTACLDIRLDGERVYCKRGGFPPIGTGNDTDEVASWQDPEGLHQDCRSCYDDDVLTHGSLQGAPMERGARVWTRTDATVNVGVRVGLMDNLSDGVMAAWAQPSPVHDFTTVLDIPGLDPAQDYYYRVESPADSVLGPILPLRASRPVEQTAYRFGLGSCSRIDSQPAFGEALALEPDLFFMLGDSHYANSAFASEHRHAYRHFRRVSPERSRLFGSVSTLSIWDDHDFLANNSNGTCLGRERILDTFAEYWANPSYGTPATPGVFYQHREGPVEFFALDCRMYRPSVGDPGNRCTPDPDPPVLSRVDGPLGPEQNAWFEAAITASDAPFKIVACGSRFTAEGSRDSWASFPEARSALEDMLHRERVEGVIFVSGDIHRSLVRTNPRSAGYAIPEITSSGIAYDLSDAPCPSEDGVRFCVREESFIMVDVDAGDTPQLTARIYLADGTLVHTWEIPRSTLMYE